MTRFLDDQEYKAAMNYIPLNCDEVEPYIKTRVWRVRIDREIHGRNSIGDEDDNNEDEEEVECESNDEEEEFQSESDFETICFYSSEDVYFSGDDVYTFGIGFYSCGMSTSPATMCTPSASASIPPRTSTPPTTLTPFPQLSYSILAPITTPSSSFVVGTSSRPIPSPSTRLPTPPMQGVVGSRILILPMADNFSKQSACAKSIIEIMKKHFVEAHASFGKIPNRIKNLWYTKFRKMYQWNPLHEHAIWDAWEKRASLRYKDLIYEMLSRRSGRRHRGIVYRGVVTRGPASAPAGLAGKNGRGEISGAKAERKRLHIETDFPILTDEQLMFEAAGGSNKGHIYSFGSQYAAITAK
ncbi:hypothetical protein M9H77_07647 [Catharanthus roseus]|uniref:Uncharacterized protein n=1 Tax=Catharanthus roseus TaxID=4058 RepID=A0ACC0BVS2_CATRO|nr:hypothetical protein M9H77_07647 [Catharanthus roseus]